MMLRARETPDSIKAGILSVMVHVLLLGALLISFNWKTTNAVSITQVELWDSLPTETLQPAPVEVTPPPEPVKPEPTPEPVKVEPPPAPEPKSEPQPEIAIEKKPVKQAQKKEPPKPDLKAEQVRKQLLEQMRQEDLKNAPKEPSKDNSEAIKKLQQALLNEDKAIEAKNSGVPKVSAASAGEVNEFKAKIQAKIRGNVNKSLCGSANPELKFEIGLIPTGELSGSPKLVKSSGNAACDDAVERAIRVSEPLPLPSDPALFTEFRNLKLTFRPTE